MTKRKPETLLELWSVHGQKLFGQHFHHAVIPDGTFAHTSQIVHMDGGARFAETLNTVYSLGRHQDHRCGRRWCVAAG